MFADDDGTEPKAWSGTLRVVDLRDGLGQGLDAGFDWRDDVLVRLSFDQDVNVVDKKMQFMGVIVFLLWVAKKAQQGLCRIQAYLSEQH
ncbi:hypothetical protein D3C72_1426880 [compost metagenome]